MPLPASLRLLLTLLNPPGMTLPSPSLQKGAQRFRRHRAHFQNLANAGGSLGLAFTANPPRQRPAQWHDCPLKHEPQAGGMNGRKSRFVLRRQDGENHARTEREKNIK